MNPYEAPRPPRKRHYPRDAKSGAFRPVEPLDDMILFGFVRDSHESLTRAARFLERVPIAGDEVAVGQVRDFVVAYLEVVAAELARDLVVGDGCADLMGLNDG